MKKLIEFDLDGQPVYVETVGNVNVPQSTFLAVLKSEQ